jgi:hypothetical protein
VHFYISKTESTNQISLDVKLNGVNISGIFLSVFKKTVKPLKFLVGEPPLISLKILLSLLANTRTGQGTGQKSLEYRGTVVFRSFQMF